MPDSHFDSFQARRVEKNIIKPNIRFIIAFDVLQFFGLISLSAVLCTVWFSSHIPRSTAWSSFNFSWTLSCVSYLLILGHQTGPLPGPALCLYQAMLIYASPALNALTFVSFTLDIFLSVSGPSSISRTTMMFLYFVPYGVFTGVLIEVFILGMLNPTAVRRAPSGIFCHILIPIPLYLTSSIVVCAMIAALILGVCITLKCRRHWSACITHLTRNRTPFGLVLRVGLVAACSILSIGLAIIEFDTFKSNTPLPVYSGLALAVLPAAVGIIFGNQGDILRVWTFWRKLPQASTSTEITSTSIQR